MRNVSIGNQMSFESRWSADVLDLDWAGGPQYFSRRDFFFFQHYIYMELRGKARLVCMAAAGNNGSAAWAGVTAAPRQAGGLWHYSGGSDGIAVVDARQVPRCHGAERKVPRHRGTHAQLVHRIQ